MFPRVRLRIRIVCVVMIAGTAVAFLILNHKLTGYGSLENLVIAMATAIEERDAERLAELCYDPIVVPFERLEKQHATLNYVAMLHENRMWKIANSWTLGGCGFRNGHIHIECVKQLDSKWYIKSI